MSEEGKTAEPQGLSSVSASVNITSRDYDIIDEDAVRSRSPSYRSIPSTGQVIPLPDKDQDEPEEGDSEDLDNNTTTMAASSAAIPLKQPGKPTTTHHKSTSGSSELNPFAKVFRPINEGGDAAPPVPPHADESDALQMSGEKLEEGSELSHVEGDMSEEQLSGGPTLPRVNCPEKIIICLDLSSEVNRVPFISRDFTKYQPLDLIKRALNIFVRTKNTMNPLHEFALVVLQDSAVWIQDFTSDVDDFINVLLDLTNETRDTDIFDLTTLFDTIMNKVDLPFVEDMFVLPPPYIVRTIFVYGRSNCTPTFCDGRESHKQLTSSPYFFFDVFYVHEPPSEENQCKEVYDVFLDLDTNNTSYIHEVGRNTTHLHNKMAMLLGHPLQRPVQMQTSHSLHPSET